MLVNGILLIFHLILYYPLWGTNDDVAIQSFFVGAKGIRDPHGIYIHYWLGKLFCRLCAFNEHIPWYPLVQYLLIYASLTAIFWVLARKLKQSSYLWLILLLTAIAAFEGYIRIQFTKTSGFLCVAGLLLLFHALSQKKLPLCPYLTGLLFCTLGSMYRFNQFQCEIAMFGALAVYFFLKILQMENRARIRQLSLCVLTAVLVIVLGYGARFVHKQAYTSQEWKDYNAYNLARATLLDYGMPDFDEYEDEYEALGIDETAYQLFKKWTHGDSEKITTEVMEQILALQPPKNVINKQFVKNYIKTVLPGFLKIQTFWLYAFILLLWLLKGKHGRQELALVCVQIITVLGMYFYFFYLGRYLLNRVDVGIWIALSAGLLWVMNEEKPFGGARTGVLLFAVCFLLSQYSSRAFLRINQADRIQTIKERRAVVEAIHDDPGHLYLTKTNTITLAKSYGVWDVIPFGIFANQQSLGGWAANTPPYMTVLEKYGINNPFRDMIDNDRVYLMDSDIDLTLEYLQTWYNENAEAELVKNIGPYEVWKIVTN